MTVSQNTYQESLILEIADAFDSAPRLGKDEDHPEGVRYIQISDTLARKISENLRSLVKSNDTRY